MATVKVHLTFPQHLIDEPVLYTLGKDFEVVPNIRRANVDGVSAWVIVDLVGEESEVERAIGWLEARGVHVSRIEEES